MAYLAMTTQFAEECRLRYGHTYVVFIYDEMARKAWASRIRSGETIDFTMETASKDEQIVDVATSMLTFVTVQASKDLAKQENDLHWNRSAQSSQFNDERQIPVTTGPRPRRVDR